MNKIEFSNQINALIGDFSYLMPEGVIILGSLLLIIFELVSPAKHSIGKTVFTWAILVISSIAIYQTKVDGVFLDGALHQTVAIRNVKLLFVVITGLVLLFPASKRLKNKGEYHYLILSILLGSFFVVQANNLLLFYIAVELISITSYVLVTFSFNRKGYEAGIKYLLFGAMASGLMLYGISLIYGLSGSLALSGIVTETLAGSLWLNMALLLFLVGVLFKLAIVPLHIWSPDIYEAGPSAVIALLSVLPKISVILFFSFFVEVAHLELLTFNWKYLLSVLAMISMLVGNFSALGQENAKRMLAYSSIAHSGILLIGIIVSSAFGYQAMVFYACIYGIMNVAAFYFTDWMEEHKLESISDLAGLGRKFPLLGISMLTILLALIGLPPTGGFTIKLLLFTSLWEAYDLQAEPYLLWLFIVGILNTAIALFYYLKIPYYLFVKNIEGPYMSSSGVIRSVFMLILSITILVAFFMTDYLFENLF